MSEYNIQMNKYNALNVEYDQLYPATKIENVDGLNTALQKKADLGEDGKVPESQLPEMDYAPSTHASQHASRGSDPITPASIGAAASSHNHSASNITAGTFAATGVKAMNGTDYTTARIRNIQASTTDLTAGSSSLANGDIYLVYE